MMTNYGFVRVAAASPKLKVADCDFNTNEILKIINEIDEQLVSAVVFPEMCITGYTLQDLFLQRLLLDEAILSLSKIIRHTESKDLIIMVGLPLEINNKLYNTGVVIHRGKIIGVVPKSFLPNYNELYDKRWFSPAVELTKKEISLLHQNNIPVGTDLIFETDEFKFSLDICEDLWTPIPPSSFYSLHGAEIIFNLSASPETVGKQNYRKSLISLHSAACYCGYVYAAAGNGESTTDLVFSGSGIIAESGEILKEGERFSFDNKYIISDIDIEKLKNERIKNKSFSLNEYPHIKNMQMRYIKIQKSAAKSIEFELKREIDPTPFIPTKQDFNEKCSEIFSIQIGGLSKRLLQTGIQNMVIGISGGLDSTLALLVLIKTCDKLNIPHHNIYGITMPGFGTTGRTYNNALALMKTLGVSSVEISIKDAVIQHFKDIDHDINIHDITYENSQARERTQILMDYANKVNGLVIGTGDLSELALGWCTYNGDHMSMYAVNSGIPKTLVKTLVGWVSDTLLNATAKEILDDILDTPVSPELLPTKNDQIVQITEDTVGPYILHDFFLYNMLRFGFTPIKIYFLAQYAFKENYTNSEIIKWMKVFYKRFFSQQFKRSCLPDGPKVGSINLSPRGDWRMPSDASVMLWMKQLDKL